MKLVEANKAKEFASTFFGDPILKMAVNAVMDNVPGVDAAPVVHGFWKQLSDKRYICDNCKSVIISHEMLCSLRNTGNWNYCPNCGAKMDGE